VKSQNKLINGLICGLIGVIIAAIISPLLWMYSSGNILIAYSLLFGLSLCMVVCLFGELMKVDPLESIQLSASNMTSEKIFMNLKNGMIFGLIGGIPFGLIGGTSVWVGGKLIITEPFTLLIEQLGESITILIIIVCFCFFCSFLGLFFGLVSGLIFGIFDNLKQELKMRFIPNQGIWNSLQFYLWTTTTILFLFPIAYTTISSFQQFWSLGLLAALIIGFAVGGGKPCLQHLSLRIVLWQSGLPWNFARFLNYCVERRLLLRVGGSYRFLHRELIDHFAQSNQLS
jgi:hypothetical protein